MPILLPPRPHVRQPVGISALVPWLPRGTLAYVGGQRRLLGARGLYGEVGNGINYSITPTGIAASSADTASIINGGQVVQAQVGSMTYVAQFVVDTNLAWLCGTAGAGTTYLEGMFVNGDNVGNQSTGRLGISYRAAGAQRVSSTIATPLVAGRLHTVAGQIVSSGVHRVFVDGVEHSVSYGVTGFPSAPGSLSEYPMGIAGLNFRGGFAGYPGLRLVLFVRIPSNTIDLERVTRTPSSPWRLLFQPRPVRAVPRVAAVPSFKAAWARANTMIGMP